MMENKEKKYQEYFSLYEKKEKRSFYKSVLLSIIFIILLVSFLFYAWNFMGKKSEEAENTIQELNYQEFIFKNREKLISIEADSLEKKIEDLQKTNNTAIDSNKLRALKNSIHNIRKITNEPATIVRYYKRYNDNPQIANIISEFGFTTNIRPVENPNEGQINVIHYGDSVEMFKVKRLARELISSGVKIKNIEQFEKHKDYLWKRHSIELGYESELEKKSSLSLREIDSL